MVDYLGLLLDMSLETDDLLATMDLDTLIEKENTEPTTMSTTTATMAMEEPQKPVVDTLFMNELRQRHSRARPVCDVASRSRLPFVTLRQRYGGCGTGNDVANSVVSALASTCQQTKARQRYEK